MPVGTVGVDASCAHEPPTFKVGDGACEGADDGDGLGVGVLVGVSEADGDAVSEALSLGVSTTTATALAFGCGDRWLASWPTHPPAMAPPATVITAIDAAARRTGQRIGRRRGVPPSSANNRSSKSGSGSARCSRSRMYWCRRSSGIVWVLQEVVE